MGKLSLKLRWKFLHLKNLPAEKNQLLSRNIYEKCNKLFEITEFNSQLCEFTATYLLAKRIACFNFMFGHMNERKLKVPN